MPLWLLSVVTNRYFIAAAAAVGVVLGAWWWHTSAVNDAVEAALTAERNRLTAEILVVERRIRDLEREHAEKLALIGQHYQKEFQNAEALRLADVARARDGALRLRIPGTFCPGPNAETATASSGGDGAQAGELPGPVAADLLQLAHDADQVARQLAYAQSVIVQQQETCNAIATSPKEPAP